MKLPSIVVCLLIACAFQVAVNADYQVGVAISDITGSAAGITFLGYANPKQVGSGIHTRQFCRAFVIEDDNGNSLVFVSTDTAMMGYFVKLEVVKRLSDKYGDIYTDKNVIISATHTHSTPGGYTMYIIPDITTWGYSEQTYNGLVNGIVECIIEAHKSKQQAKIFVSTGTVLDANINRSPTSYMLNPEEERKRYEYDTDKELVQLKFVAGNNVLGAFNWFAVHPTSMNSSNTLISSDNVGYASLMLEKEMNGDALTGKGAFVGAFASTNLGDVSPNTGGSICVDSGKPCEDIATSTCNNLSTYCRNIGPGENQFKSTEIIGRKLTDKALELLKATNGREVTGPVKTIHQYVDMPSQKIEYEYNDGSVATVSGCLPAMGYSFSAGTLDGPGLSGIHQGMLEGIPLWDTLRDLLAKPTDEDITCQAPKPILLATGRMVKPYPWHPRIVPTQVVMIGNVIILAVPGEFTTMAGRRLRSTILNAVQEANGPADPQVIVAGLSTLYTHYITTYEEYQAQRYEAASTIYGPYTFAIYQQKYENLTVSLIKDQTLSPGPTPDDFTDSVISLILPVIIDIPPFGYSFGDCVQQPDSSISKGGTAIAKFVSGHPRNSLMHGSSFLTVEMQQPENGWSLIATDANWDTKFKWQRKFLASSEATIEWAIGSDVALGNYRICHKGYYKSIGGQISFYNGCSRTFQVVA